MLYTPAANAISRTWGPSSRSVEGTNIDRGGAHTTPLTDDANTLEFFDPVDVDETYHGIDGASELGVVMELNDKICVAVVDLLGPDR